MARQFGYSTTSSRHGFSFNRVPTYCRGDMRYTQKDYAAILDCVYEMADMIANSNGVSNSRAIDTVLETEGWVILPTHRTMILKKLEE